MGCGSFGTDKVLIGLHLVGLSGLRDALVTAEQTGLTEREALLEFLLTTVSKNNYIPGGNESLYQRALWREYLRFRGEAFSEFFSEIEIEITGTAGAERDRFLEMTATVFKQLELAPVITYRSPIAEESNPQLWISGEPIVIGHKSHEKFKTAVHRTISDW